MNRLGPKILSGYVNGIAILFLLPIVIVVVISFSGNGYLRFPPSSYSLQWYGKIFGNAEWLRALWLSTSIALLSCIATVVTAGTAAFGLSRGAFGGKNLILSLLLLPMIVPTIVAAIGLYFVSMQLGLVGNVVWIALCHTAVCVPAVLLILLSTFHGIDVNLERAAMSLGCNRLGVFRRVLIPLAAPGLLSGAFVAFLGSFDEFIISLFLMGTRGETLPVRIYHSLFLEIEPTIAAVSAVLIGFSATLMLVDRINRRRRRPATREAAAAGVDRPQHSA